MKEIYAESIVDLVIQSAKSGLNEEAIRRHAVASIQTTVDSASAIARADSVVEFRELTRSVADVTRRYAGLAGEYERLRRSLDELGPYMERINEMRSTEMGQKLDAAFSAQRERARRARVPGGIGAGGGTGKGDG